MSFLKDGDRWAFPTTIENGTAYGDVGMTLRGGWQTRVMIIIIAVCIVGPVVAAVTVALAWGGVEVGLKIYFIFAPFGWFPAIAISSLLERSP